MGGDGCYSKGGTNAMNNRSGGGGRRWCSSWGLMLMLAFMAALLGVMAVHRLRERRVFNLLMQQKNTHLLSLQLLLEKEKEYNKEMKGKAEELKAKIYAINAQKMESDRRLLEMQSRMDSLRNEHKAISQAMEEMQKEVKLLRDTDSLKRNSQIMALTEIIKQKEAEIRELKHQIENPVTNFPANFKTNESILEGVKTEDAWKNKYQKEGSLANSTFVEEESENRTAIHANGISTANATEATVETIGNVMKVRDEGNEMKPMGGQIQKITRDEPLGSLGDSQATSTGVKLRVPTGSRLSRKRLSKGKGKRWRMLAKSRLTSENRGTSMESGAKSTESGIAEGSGNRISEAYRYHGKEKDHELQTNTSHDGGITSEITQRNMSNGYAKHQESKEEEMKAVKRKEMVGVGTELAEVAGKGNFFEESVLESEEDQEETNEDEF